jgi:hypothetical protein
LNPVGRAYAASLGTVALLATLVRGWALDLPPDDVLLAAWTNLCLFAGSGFLVGWLATGIVDESVRTKLATELAARNVAPLAPSPVRTTRSGA